MKKKKIKKQRCPYCLDNRFTGYTGYENVYKCDKCGSEFKPNNP
jgi:ribosomal protein L37AE/L43A